MTESVFDFEGKSPLIGERAWVAPGAQVMGDVELGEGANIWYGSVLRGDVHQIRVGARTNIQDLSVIHITSHEFGTYIGDDVTVGHRAILHGCTVERGCLIGMGAIILDGAHIGEFSLIGAGALISPGKKIPPRSVVLGAPGRIVRQVTDEEVEGFLLSAKHYVELAERHRLSATSR